jgi:prolyl-tRNA synthetase
MSKKWEQSDIDKLQQKSDVKKRTHSKTDLKPISANALTKSAIHYFSAKGFECWRNNNAAVWDKKNNCYRSNSAKKGVPDIIGYHKQTGVALWVEVKVGKDKLSTEQQQFLNDATKANCFVQVIRTIHDLENFFKTQK